MRVYIMFHEAANYAFDSIENYIRHDAFGQKYLTVIGIDSIIGDELKQILIDDYFNGAELAVNYIGADLDKGHFIFDLNPA